VAVVLHGFGITGEYQCRKILRDAVSPPGKKFVAIVPPICYEQRDVWDNFETTAGVTCGH
jgi:hypothetical protein